MSIWVFLTLLEGFGLGIARFFYARVGKKSPTLSHNFFAGALAGLVQAFVACVLLAISKHEGNASFAKRNLRISGWHALASIGLGVFGFGANFCAFKAFQTSAPADMGANAFISTALGIIPLALCGRKWFNEPLGQRQWTGIAIALIGACLAVRPWFGGGSFVWVVWSLGTMIFAATNELISRRIKKWEDDNQKPKLNPWTQQLLGGTAMMTTALLLFFISSGPSTRSDLIVPGMLWLYAVGAGICNIGWWACRFYAYEKKAPVSIRRFPAVAVNLLTSTVIGIAGFNDPFAGDKFFGIFLFAPAFFCVQNRSEEWPKAWWGHAKIGLGHLSHIAHATYPKKATGHTLTPKAP